MTKRRNLTRAAQTRLHLAILTNQLSAVSQQISFTDTMRGRFLDRLTDDELDWLSRLNGEGKVFRLDTKFGNYANGVNIHQPSREALNFLKLIRPDCLVTRADPAWDLVVADDAQRMSLAMSLIRYLAMRWHGSRVFRDFNRTIYYARAGHGRYFVIYYHSPSKVAKIATIHIELRLTSAESCRRYGLGTIDGILSYDSAGIFDRNAMFAFLDGNTFNKKVNVTVTRQMLRSQPKRSGYSFSRSDLRRRLRYRVGRDVVGEDYDANRPLEPQILIQKCIDAKLPLFDGAIAKLPLKLLSPDMRHAWPMPSIYNNEGQTIAKWEIM